jgi:hypothetical protein
MHTVLNTQAARTTCWAIASAVVVTVVPALVEAQGQPQRQLIDTQTVNMPVPAVIHQLKTHEVVERIISQGHDVLLSDQLFAELKALHKAVFEERAIYESTSKPPAQRPVWITSPEQALAKAFTILTSQQQHQSLMLFGQERRP